LFWFCCADGDFSIHGEGFQDDAEPLAVIMGEGHTYFCPEIATLFCACADGIDMVRRFFLLCVVMIFFLLFLMPHPRPSLP
jgi:hypothetical protein